MPQPSTFSMRAIIAAVFATFVPCIVSSAFAVSPSFTGLGTLSGDSSSSALAISDDGSTVVGYSGINPNNVTRAFRWTAATGMVAIGDLPGGNSLSIARGVSADGSVIVGDSSSAESYSHHPFYNEPFRWTQSEGMTALGYIPDTNGRYGAAYGVSGNGQVIVGYSNGNTGGHPFRWTSSAGMSNLGDLDNNNAGSQDAATAINYDGSVIVGMATLGSDRLAFRWTASGGMQSLGLLPSASSDPFSSASDVSVSGDVVVGSSRSASGGIEAFRWTPGGGMTGLGYLPGASQLISEATAVSADGMIIVGNATDAANGTRAVRWDPVLGIQKIQDLLAAQGLGSELAGWDLNYVTGISADGQTITGYGNGPSGIQAWVATIPIVTVPEPSSLALGMSAGLALVIVTRRRSRRISAK